MRTGMFLLGGGLAGGGVLTAVMGGFGVPGGATATQISKVGFDAIGNLTIFPQGQLAIAMFFTGVALMIAGSANAYKETGGY